MKRMLLTIASTAFVFAATLSIPTPADAGPLRAVGRAVVKAPRVVKRGVSKVGRGVARVARVARRSCPRAASRTSLEPRPQSRV